MFAILCELSYWFRFEDLTVEDIKMCGRQPPFVCLKSRLFDCFGSLRFVASVSLASRKVLVMRRNQKLTKNPPNSRQIQIPCMWGH